MESLIRDHILSHMTRIGLLGKKPQLFNKVPHKSLLSTLMSYGRSDEIEDWVKAFLSDRQHKVCLNGVSSSWVDVTSGILKGIVLGPVLFVLYINDLTYAVNYEVYLCVDDTKLFSEVSPIEDSASLQRDLDNLRF